MISTGECPGQGDESQSAEQRLTVRKLKTNQPRSRLTRILDMRSLSIIDANLQIQAGVPVTVTELS